VTPQQRAILRAYGGWMLADILIDPGRGIAHAKQSHYGTTSVRVEGEEFWMQTTSRGIELSRQSIGSDRSECEVLPWSQIARFARSLPAWLVAELRSHREQLTRCTLARPAFPIRGTDEAKQRWEHTEYAPWLAHRHSGITALDAALDRALLAGHTEQAALFNVADPQSQPVATRPPGPHGRSAARGHVQDRLL
jgi:hypothetical protein